MGCLVTFIIFFGVEFLIFKWGGDSATRVMNQYLIARGLEQDFVKWLNESERGKGGN